MIDMEVIDNNATVGMEVDEIPPHNHNDDYYTEEEVDEILESYRTSSEQSAIDSAILSVANGKTANYAVSVNDNDGFDTQEDEIEIASFTTTDGETHSYTELKVGCNIFVTDEELPDRWVSEIGQSSATLLRLESARPNWGELGGSMSEQTDLSNALSNITTAISTKMAANQGVSNAGKAMVVGQSGAVEYADQFAEVSSVTRWNVIRPNQTETPNLTLPTPESGKPQEILYVFTAMTTGATFTAPSGYSLFDEDKTLATATNSIAYTDLTVCNLYECDFLVVGPNKISLLKVEHAGV